MSVRSILKLMPVRSAKRSTAPAPRKMTEGRPDGQRVKEAPLAAAEPIQLSDEAHLFRAVGRMLERTPETRKERVKAVKEKIAGERYQVDNRHLARLILEEVEDSRRDYRAAA